MKAEEPTQPDPKDEQVYRVAYLIGGYLLDTLVQSEHRELDDWVTASIDNQRVFEELTDEKYLQKWIEWRNNLPVSHISDRLRSKLVFTPEPRKGMTLKSLLPYVAAACAIIAIVLTCILIWLPKNISNVSRQDLAANKVEQDFAPGVKRVTLTLEDGTTKQLDNEGSGVLTKQGNAFVIKDDSGRLVYRPSNSTQNEGVVFNRLQVSKGSQYQLRLSDGTKVWLNAASSLKYPASFTGARRQVMLTGEAYFEVATDFQHPFSVIADQSSIVVLGTAFNVNAYSEGHMVAVTLAQGKVKVLPERSDSTQEVLLNPGDQARIDSAGSAQVKRVNVESILAWQRNLFVFRDATIEEIMPQLARWYDMEIVYEGRITQHFNATISREVPISEALHYLEGTKHVHFRVNRNEIVVMP